MQDIKLTNRLKVVFVEQNRTSKWLAETIEKNETIVSRWCSNTIQPSLDMLVAIAQVLNVRCEIVVEYDKVKG